MCDGIDFLVLLVLVVVIVLRVLIILVLVVVIGILIILVLIVLVVIHIDMLLFSAIKYVTFILAENEYEYAEVKAYYCDTPIIS